MISTFTNKNTVFFPTRWANSVSQWITGLFSRTGNIVIQNTADPSSGGCSIDVNVEVLYAQLRERLMEDFVPRAGLGDAVARASNGSLSMSSGSLSVNDSFVNRTIEPALQQVASDAANV